MHMHSDISLDGQFNPGELAALCRKAGLNTVSLTDHNSVRGVEEMMLSGREQGLKVLPGIELDCVCRGTDLHLLGYGIDITDRRFGENEQNILEQKRDNSKACMKILKEAGILFEEKKVMELAREGIVVGEMIAEAAMAEERNRQNPLMRPYFPGGERSDNPYVNFFWDFCSQGKPAYMPVEYPSFEEALKLIKETGGKAVIAHPVNTVKKDEEMIAYMVRCGVEGIEVYSSYHSLEDREYYRELSARLGVNQTFGSDFHGKNKPAVRLGMTGAPPDAGDADWLFQKGGN